nr:glycosyltransferase [Mucilaginibacter sp. L294]
MQSNSPNVLFITDRSNTDYVIPGGVQLCTNEFITYFENAGYPVDLFKVRPAVTIINRIKIRLGIGPYSIYDINLYIKDIVERVKIDKIKLVLFNQLNLAHWVSDLKKNLPADVKFICLSHGNESGDYLHDITKTHKISFISTWRLGKLLVYEKHLFNNLDGVIVISKPEIHINNWIGAKQILYLPRILSPTFINWQQNNKRIGFVGTLNHLPNITGIKLLAAELKKSKVSTEFVVVGGPESIGHDLEKEYSFIKYKGRLSNEELMNEAKTWTVFLNPVFWYARGSSTKLAQAINWGIPVITTPAGTRGYELSHHAIITEDNTPASFVNAIIKALSSPRYLTELKTSVEANSSNFDLKHYADKLRTFIEHVCTTKP